MNLSGSSPTLAGNIISSCSYGVMVSGASPVIVSNRIIGSYGVLYSAWATEAACTFKAAGPPRSSKRNLREYGWVSPAGPPARPDRKLDSGQPR